MMVKIAPKLEIFQELFGLNRLPFPLGRATTVCNFGRATSHESRLSVRSETSNAQPWLQCSFRSVCNVGRVPSRSSCMILRAEDTTLQNVDPPAVIEVWHSTLRTLS